MLDFLVFSPTTTVQKRYYFFFVYGKRFKKLEKISNARRKKSKTTTSVQIFLPWKNLEKNLQSSQKIQNKSFEPKNAFFFKLKKNKI